MLLATEDAQLTVSELSVGVTVVSVVERFARYCTYRWLPSALMSPPLATPTCQPVQVPSGVAVFPARTSTVIAVLAGVVALYESEESVFVAPVSITAEVNVPEEAIPA